MMNIEVSQDCSQDPIYKGGEVGRYRVVFTSFPLVATIYIYIYIYWIEAILLIHVFVCLSILILKVFS